MNRSHHNDPRQWLAAEFALGVLEGEALAIARHRFETDPEFRRDVEIWEQQLSPLLDEVEPMKPSPQLWRQVEQELFDDSSDKRTGWWTSLSFWRGASVAAAGLATAALAMLLWLPTRGLLVTPAPDQDLVAALVPSAEAPAFFARLDADNRRLTIRVTAGATEGAGRVPELWLIPGDGVPRSLGLLSTEGAGDVTVDPAVLPLARAGTVLAISLEPAGGSPSGAPTGPVIATGALRTLE